jgi:hypothetical protein
LSEKSKLTAKFLKRKVAEYEMLQLEIDLLKAEVAKDQMLQKAHERT